MTEPSNKSQTEQNQNHLLEDILIHKTDKKQKNDRFLYPRKWNQRRRSDLYPYNDSASESVSPNSQRYVKCLTKSLSQSPQSLRSFTMSCMRQKIEKKRKPFGTNSLRKQGIEPFRKYRVLGWKDNYYTNLLDWSYNNFICTGFLNDLCLYNMQIDDDFESSLSRVYTVGMSGQSLASLKSSPFQTKVSLGYSNGTLKLYDYFKYKQIYNGYHHLLRIASIQWKDNLIITGSKDQFLKLFDVRGKKPLQTTCNIQRAHTQQICGIKQMGNLVASGGNDNRVFIYDIRKMEVLSSYTHQAAVKGICWMNNHTLVTGGGTADKKLKFWKDGEGVFQNVDTGSQVCGVGYSQNTDQIYSCQGFSLNQIIIWSKEGQRVFTFHGHSTRVLYSALSPKGEYLASGAGDQTLKIWKLFPSKTEKSDLSIKDIR